METKNIQNNITLSLLLSSLKEKRNWFLVSVIIMLITLVLMPMILGFRVNEGIIVAGILEIGFLLFISGLIDFSYLHDSRKLTWYASKPVGRMQRINTLILSNLVFVAVLLTLLLAIGFLSVTGIKFEYLRDIYLVGMPWLLIEIFVIALSSLLTGNTIAAAVASVVNFTMPLSLLAIINYGFDVVGHFAAGFNPRILFNNFVENFYRIDAIYFVKYVNDNFSPIYFLVLAVWLVIFYSLSLLMTKKRKNEKTGEFVVADGYKYLITLLLASLVPIGFSAIFYDNSIAEKLLSFVILFGLAFYLINAVLEKSFKLEKYAIKLFVVFLASFFIFIGATNITAGKFVNIVPNVDEVQAVYFDRSNYVYSSDYMKTWNIYDVTLEEIEKSTDITLYKDPESIKSIINFHQEAIKNQDYYYNSNFNIVYFYKDGQKLSRYYNFLAKDGDYSQKDKYIREIINSQEFKDIKIPLIFNDAYFKEQRVKNISAYYEKIGWDTKYINDSLDLYLDENDLDLLREYLKKDFNQVMIKAKEPLNYALVDQYGYYPYSYMEKEGETVESFYLQFEYQSKEDRDDRKSKHFSFRITTDFTYTFDYLNKVRNGRMNGEVNNTEQIL